MSTRRPECRNEVCSWFLIVLAYLCLALGGQAGTGMPTLLHDRPVGFSVASGEEAETWISDRLDGVIHVYQFRPLRGDFHDEFRRGLFRDIVSPPYREDRLLGPPTFKALQVRGADAAMTASFRNFNGGASREHLRVAVLSTRFVALVDFSANSPQGFERNQQSVVQLLKSLEVSDGQSSAPRPTGPGAGVGNRR